MINTNWTTRYIRIEVYGKGEMKPAVKWEYEIWATNNSIYGNFEVEDYLQCLIFNVNL